MKRCPDCKMENVDAAKFCRNCGHNFSATVRIDPDPPPPRPAPVPPPPAPTPRPDKRAQNRRTLLLAGGALGVLVLAGLVWGGLALLRGRGGSHIVIMQQQRSDSWDVLALRLGAELADAQLLAEDIDDAGPFTALALMQDQQYSESANARFVPGRNEVLLLLAHDGEALLQQAQLGRDELTTLFESRSDLTTFFDVDASRFLLLEDRASGTRCYTLRAGERESRIGRGDTCYFEDSSHALLNIEEDSDEFVLTVSDIDGGNEVELLNLEQYADFELAPDASHLAYIEQLRDGQQLYLVTRSNGTSTPISKQYEQIMVFEFAADRSDVLYYIGETEDGKLELLTTRSDVPIASGELLGAAISADGNHLIYTTGELGDMQAFAVDLGSGNATAITRGEDLRVAILDAVQRLLVIDETQDGELMLTTSNMAGGDVVTILSEDGTLSNLQLLDSRQLLIALNNVEGNSLYLSATAADESTLLADGWSYFSYTYTDADAGFLALRGVEQEGDPEGLYAVELNGDLRPLLLDDDFSVLNAVLTPDRRSVLYSVRLEDGDYELRQVLRDGSERPELLYRDAMLADAQWLPILSGRTRIGWRSAQTSSIPCPGAPTLALSGQADGSLTDEEGSDCYRIAATADELVSLRAIIVDGSDMNLMLTVLDREGNPISGGGTPYGRAPRSTHTFAESATYFVQVDLQSGSGDYTLFYETGPGDPAFAAAAPLPFDTRTRGAITTRTYFAKFDDELAANVYYFDGSNGTTVQIDAFASSLGSEIDPYVYLYDAALNELGSNDDGGNGLDSRLTYRLRADGRYYIMVYNLRDEVGSADTHFYELLLSR